MNFVLNSSALYFRSFRAKLPLSAVHNSSLLVEESNYADDSKSISLSSEQDLSTEIQLHSTSGMQTEITATHSKCTQTISMTMTPQLSAISIAQQYQQSVGDCPHWQILPKRNSINCSPSARDLLKTTTTTTTPTASRHENRHSPLAAIICGLFFAALFAWTYWNSEILFGYLPHCLRIYVANRLQQFFDIPPVPKPVELSTYEIWMETVTSMVDGFVHAMTVFLNNLLFLQRDN